MALEASIVERLQELRRWQVEQQERLLKEQQEQREMLSRKQDRMYQALSLSIQDCSFDETSVKTSSAKYKDILKDALGDLSCLPIKNDEYSEQLKCSNGDRVDADDHCSFQDSLNATGNQECCKNGTTPEKNSSALSPVARSTAKPENSDINGASLSPPSLHSDLYLNVPNVQSIAPNESFSKTTEDKLDGTMKTTHACRDDSLLDRTSQHLALRMDGVESSLQNDTAKKRILLDDIPVPSPRKDFQTLLEERLKDSGAIINPNDVRDNAKKLIKRPFLRKGEGLARFRAVSNPENASKRVRSRSASLSANVCCSKYGDSKNISGGSKKAKETSKVAKKNTQSTRKNLTVPGTAQLKLNLKNIAPPRNKIRSKSMSTSPTSSSRDNHCKKPCGALNHSDLESKTRREMEEVRIFELLEEKAENSSFCSTSSTVVALMQQSMQSTPLKTRAIFANKLANAIVQQANADVERDRNEEALLEEIVRTTKSNTVDRVSPCVNCEKKSILKEVPLPQWESVTAVNSDPSFSRNAQRLMPQREIWNDDEYLSDSTLDHKEKICELPYGTDIDPAYEADYSKFDEVDTETIHQYRDTDDREVSLHVRFSKYNEYKTIGLTDTSSIYSESPHDPQENDNEERVCNEYSYSSTNPSDAEVSSTAEVTTAKAATVQQSAKFASRERHGSDVQDKLSESSEKETSSRVLKHEPTKSQKLQKVPHVVEVDACNVENQETKARNALSSYSEVERDTSKKMSPSSSCNKRYENEYFDVQQPAYQTSDEEPSNFEDCQEFSDIDEDVAQTVLSYETKDRANEERDNIQVELFSSTESLVIDGERTITDVEKVEKENGMIFKSELLKSRLLELEREIEIFRRENTALSQQRQKLQEERKTFERQFKEKESSFQEERRKIQESLQEEKKRLTREKSALESRLKDAQQKAQQSKLERQEMQILKDQLEELREEMNQKESRSNAAQARQRSQVRSLQAENAKLKQEIERLQCLRRGNSKIKRSTSATNTRAIHQINKHLDDRKKSRNRSNSPKDEDKLVQPMMEALYPECEMVEAESYSNRDVDSSGDGSKTIVYENLRRSSIDSDGVSKKRELYANLLKDATMGLSESQEATRRVTEEFERSKSHARSHQSSKEDETTADNHSSDSTEASSSFGSIKEKDPRIKDYSSASRVNDVVIGDTGRNGSSENYDQTRSNSPFHNKSSLERAEGKFTSNVNKQGIKEVRHSDGRLEYWYPNGNVKKVSADRAVTKIIYYNGDVRENNKDGTIKYFYAATRTWHTTMPDGLEILEFPDGQVERRTKSGTVEVSFPDGSVRILQSDGSERWALPDGTIAETFANGEKVLALPNGQREVHTKDHKRREYPDGTVKLVYPDGMQETRYSNGRVRLKDWDGNLVMDSHHG